MSGLISKPSDRYRIEAAIAEYQWQRTRRRWLVGLAVGAVGLLASYGARKWVA